MHADKMLYAYVRDQIIPLDQAFLHISDLSIQRGYGVFDFFRVYRGKFLFLQPYLDRFYGSAEMMNLQVPLARPQLERVLAELQARNGLESAGVKMVLTGGYSPDGYVPGEPNLLITQHPLHLPDADLVSRGIKVITHDYCRELPRAKTINYTMGIRLLDRVRQEGAADVLYHRQGVVSEFPRANFFLVRADGTVATPVHDTLLGVTRRHVLDLAGQRYRTEEGIVTLEDIAQAREAFMTSTTKRILPIVQVDNLQIGNGQPGPVSQALLRDLVELEEQALARV